MSCSSSSTLSFYEDAIDDDDKDDDDDDTATAAPIASFGASDAETGATLAALCHEVERRREDLTARREMARALQCDLQTRRDLVAAKKRAADDRRDGAARRQARLERAVELSLGAAERAFVAERRNVVATARSLQLRAQLQYARRWIAELRARAQLTMDASATVQIAHKEWEDVERTSIEHLRQEIAALESEAAHNNAEAAQLETAQHTVTCRIVELEQAIRRLKVHERNVQRYQIDAKKNDKDRAMPEQEKREFDVKSPPTITSLGSCSCSTSSSSSSSSSRYLTDKVDDSE